MSLQSIILAAGKGTRMKSKHPKVMHSIFDVPMIDYVLKNCCALSEKKPIVVVGHAGDTVKEYLSDSADCVFQREQLGTGHAVMMGIDLIEEDDDVLIICGDTPLITDVTLQKMIELKKHSDAVVMSAVVKNPLNYGRIIRNGEHFSKIVEEKDATDEQRQICEINAGTYIISGKVLKEQLGTLKTENSQGEYYLTDVFENVAKEGIVSLCIADEDEIIGINNRQQLAQATQILKRRINHSLMDNGVTILDEDTTYIDPSVVIGQDTIIYPNTRISGNTVIGEDCIIRENTTIENSTIMNGVEIKSSTLLEAVVEEYSTIGPYAYLRPKAHVGKHVKIGDFVEVKNSKIGDYSKASHLAYIGDADVGKNVNIGCGVVFVNYDGKNKHRTTVGDNSFIGSNSNLVAPVEIGDMSFVAAGSTITIDVPDDALCIARNKERIKENWTSRKGLIKKK
ncbi:UDP-N-acetylglucosamine diphosphorylase/glucosamine-1-phosphate N-acetyltransferase [Filifactor alocis ATCC 35896]|uniref:Bifunctional protein GlmU n=1 Tax=Filifactor alocis (strain ATCC 35896 / CCUG 47790 / D40 B5) TaxID=546269 RepID=D6GSL9_FILAD|nr:bifunctional UDP-N-acetylglucosamine diphosphorylase/glucosamine-1-phosphate N-acetyltransferase GlmU [Filifactor alocis]EFE28660.1 UDP-N-acetylglucosamine diphosphorylase/glucosamine-1-phosphate N-acetyltransferase [Filifactor alocis ATCC 35896]